VSERNLRESADTQLTVAIKMSTPELPFDVLVTVAEFLAGDHAFGTLAALHQTSRELKEGTLAVLYETFFLDKGPGLVKASAEGLLHTKSV
jgi:hypothetical protein